MNIFKCRILCNRFKPEWVLAKSYSKFSFEDQYVRTTVDILNKRGTDEPVMIEKYSRAGFQLSSGFYIIGPVVMFAKTVLQWKIGDVKDINPDSLSLFTMLEPKLDLLIIGKGDQSVEVNPKVAQFMSLNKIGLEILPTEKACSLLNYMIMERRMVAAALLPPTKIETFALPSIILQEEEKDLVQGDAFDLKESLKSFEKAGHNFEPPKALGEEEFEKEKRFRRNKNLISNS